MPWTTRLSASINSILSKRWESLQRAGAADDETTRRRQRFAWLILGGANMEDVKFDDVAKAIQPFSQRVGRRFEAHLLAHEDLRMLVQRLDYDDNTRVQVALIEAAQGIRVAGVLVALGVVVAAAALAEIAVRAIF